MGTFTTDADQAIRAFRETCETELVRRPFGVYYFGRRLPSGRGVVLVGDDGALIGALPVRSELGLVQNDSWDWGNTGPGALQLGVALLAERIADPATSIACHREFTAQVVARLPRENWILSGIDVARWHSAWENARQCAERTGK